MHRSTTGRPGTETTRSTALATRRNPSPRDLVHRFYQEQYQLNGGRQNRYVTGSDTVGLA
jgi:phospholipase C